MDMMMMTLRAELGRLPLAACWGGWSCEGKKRFPTQINVGISSVCGNAFTIAREIGVQGAGAQS